MKRVGHVGVAMVCYAPLGVALVGTGRTDLAMLGEMLVVSLAMAPDCDNQLPFVKHRGVTHTLGFAVLVGLALAGVSLMVTGEPIDASARGYAAFGFGVGVTAVSAHLIADALTPAGVRPLWPLSRRRVTLGLTSADDLLANYALLCLGVAVTLGLVVVLTDGQYVPEWNAFVGNRIASGLSVGAVASIAGSDLIR